MLLASLAKYSFMAVHTFETMGTMVSIRVPDADTASPERVTALDAAVARNVNLVVSEQSNVLGLAQRLVQACGHPPRGARAQPALALHLRQPRIERHGFVDPRRCTGCGDCAALCPAPTPAIHMLARRSHERPSAA